MHGQQRTTVVVQQMLTCHHRLRLLVSCLLAWCLNRSPTSMRQVRQRGLGALYMGIVPRLAQQIPSSTICW
jgi:hypothetical protein